MPKRLLLVLLVLTSCKTQPNSDREYDKFDPGKTYALQLSPSNGSNYRFDIVNESKTVVEVEGKETTSETKTSLGVLLKMDKDSSGDFQMNLTYDKIHLYSKAGDTETEADAANGAGSFNPLDRMLGLLKEAKLTASLSPGGELKDIKGYRELGDKMVAMMDPNDVSGREIAKSQWERQIGDRLIKANVEQLFKIFPDSLVHLNDTWRISSKQGGEIGLVVKNTFTLKAINSDVAVISIQGKINSEDGVANVLGMNNVKLDLSGEQEGELEMEVKTGMMISSRMKARVTGKMMVMGRDMAGAGMKNWGDCML